MSKRANTDKKTQIAAITPPKLGDVIAGFSNAPVTSLLLELTSSKDQELARQIKEQLFECANTWQHLALVEPAVRAACAIVSVEGETSCQRLFHELYDPSTPSSTPLSIVNILTRYILNDPLLILDDRRPFDIDQELDLQSSSVALVAAFIVRRNLDTLATMDKSTAENILKIAEIRVSNWPARITRLVDEYERTTYKAKSIAGSSST